MFINFIILLFFLLEKNRNYLSPDIIANMRDSDDKTVNFMFTNPLSNTGRLQISRNNHGSDEIQFSQSKSQQSMGKFTANCLLSKILL